MVLRTAARASSFLIPYFLIFPSSSILPFSYHILFLAGDIGQMNLPVGMQNLNLVNTKVTGKATSE